MVAAASFSYAAEVEIAADADATILMDNPEANKGAEQVVWAFAGPEGAMGNAAKSYLHFDASALNGRAADVRFLATYLAKRDRGAEIWLVNKAPAWKENELTWANAPSNDPASPHLLTDAVMLGAIGGRGAGNEIPLEFSNASAKAALLDALNSPPRKVTLVIVQRPYAQASTFTIASRESPSHPAPRLVIAVDGKK